MKLSVVIVNYNVKYFLEQCLYSVIRAAKSIKYEVFIVDNNSVDGSCSMIKQKFPDVKLIENNKNLGFSKANNLAIRQAQGEYVLLLNPDTVVEENTFNKIIKFMDNTPDAGALGVKMIDGNGDFLPESKRALPTPWVAFYKIFGFSRLFPHSPKFSKYHLGYLDNEKIHQVEILSGAFMLIRKEALDKSGLLDESFFMYGEDIDLSYRIIQAGYHNYYYPKTTIIHYKGESTKKGSINYVLVFYNAMIIFAQKHFSKKNASLYTFFIKSAVYFRAGLSVIKRFFTALFWPLIDSILIFSGYYFIQPNWEKVIFPQGGGYPPIYLNFIVPSYIAVWLIAVWLSGGYEKPVKLKNVGKGMLAGTFFLLVVYSLLNEAYRYSRAMLLMGAAWGTFSLLAVRYLLHLTGIKEFELHRAKRKKIIIVGHPGEAKRVLNVLNQTDIKSEFVGFVNLGQEKNSNHYIGNIDQLYDIVNINKVDEIIFCAQNISSQKIIKTMLYLSSLNVNYKIAPPESISIIGSNSIDTAGDLYVVTLNSITRPSNQRNKRILDIMVAITLLFFSPIMLFLVAQPKKFFKNCFHVIRGKKTWVGYTSQLDIAKSNLPKIRQGILSPEKISQKKSLTIKDIEKINIIYAKNYQLSNDLQLIVNNLKYLGNE